MSTKSADESKDFAAEKDVEKSPGSVSTVPPTAPSIDSALERRKPQSVMTAAEAREKILADVEFLAQQAIADAKGLYLSPGEKGYNPDATVPWVECSVRTRFSIEVYKQIQANKREREATTRTLGAIVLRGGMDAKSWEAQAREVNDASERATIDVTSRVLGDDAP